MTTVHDVPAEELINRLAEELRDTDAVESPEWGDFVKTGQHNELPPEDPDWWYTRVAAVFRKTYVNGPVGISGLKTAFGGRERSGMTPAHQKDGSGSIVREALQQLEDAGYVETVEGKGRKVTPEGQSYLDELASELTDEIEGLERY